MKTHRLVILFASVLFACSGSRVSTEGASQPAGGAGSSPTSPTSLENAASSPAPATVAASSPAPAKAEERPLYYERLLTPEDLEGRTLRELSLMRNWIYARAGNQFVISWLNDFFSQQPWYKPKDKLDMSVLTDIDRENAKLIYEAERKSPEELDFMEAMIFARHGYLRPGDPEELKERVRAAIPGFKEDPSFTADKLTENDFIELNLIYGQRGIALEGEANYDTSIYHAKEKKWYSLSEIAMKGGKLDPVWYDSIDRLFKVEELRKKSQRELRLLRNTIYARRGRPFKSKFLQFYFQFMAWYSPDPGYTDARLTKTDRRNIQLIRSVEDEKGGPLSDIEQMKSEGWIYDPEYGWGPGA